MGMVFWGASGQETYHAAPPAPVRRRRKGNAFFRLPRLAVLPRWLISLVCRIATGAFSMIRRPVDVVRSQLFVSDVDEEISVQVLRQISFRHRGARVLPARLFPRLDPPRPPFPPRSQSPSGVHMHRQPDDGVQEEDGEEEQEEDGGGWERGRAGERGDGEEREDYVRESLERCRAEGMEGTHRLSAR
jgi:hypothetical protein